MKNLAIARRYAKALLLIGEDDGQAEVYREELDSISGLVAREAELEQAICNPLYDISSRKKVLQAIIDRLNPSVTMKNYLLLLFEKGRIGFLRTINEFYHKFADELKGIARATLISATELTSEAVDKITSALSKKTGKDVILEVKQDAEFIGGIVTRIGDLVLDGSVKTQLLNMRESLKKGEGV